MQPGSGLQTRALISGLIFCAGISSCRQNSQELQPARETTSHQSVEQPEENAPNPEKMTKKNNNAASPGKPLICINGKVNKPNRIHPRIGRSLRKYGAEVARINSSNFDELKERCDGAFLVGGGDLDMTRVRRDERIHPASQGHLIAPARQYMDEEIVKWARSEKVPLFGECLGLQEVGVWEGSGANLIQHIPDQEKSEDHRKPHRVLMNNQGLFFGNSQQIVVNSNHHQALKEPLPESLMVVGRSRDRIVEAVISKDKKFYGIQWHPNETEADEIPYKNFVDVVKRGGKL